MCGLREARYSSLSLPDALSILALLQGAYFLASGIWPILHMRSFLAVTGPKTDLWLVRTVGTVLAVIGAVLLLAGWSARITTEIVLLGVGSAGGLATIDVVYVAKRVIPKIYLLDAAAEAVLIVTWVVLWGQVR